MKHLLGLLVVLALVAPSRAAIDGLDDTIIVYGNSGANTAPFRGMVSGMCKAAGAVSGVADSGRGRWSGQGVAYGGLHYSTTTNTNDWAAGDFEADVYWFRDIYDTLLKDCIGTAALDTQYISKAELEFTLTTKTGTITNLRAKLQGPVLIRPRPNGIVTGSGNLFGGASPDSTSFNKLKRVAGDTVLWRKKTLGPMMYDTASKIGNASGDYEQTIAVGTSTTADTTRYELGQYSTNGDLTGHVATIVWDPNGTTAGSRAVVDITTMFKTGLLACVSGASTMRTEGFGVFMNWTDAATPLTRDSITGTIANTWIRICATNTTAATSMELRIVLKTDADHFCANKDMDALPLKFPWYRRAHTVPGQLRGNRDSVKKPGLARQRPPQ